MMKTLSIPCLRLDASAMTATTRETSDPRSLLPDDRRLPEPDERMQRDPCLLGMNACRWRSGEAPQQEAIRSI